MKFNKYKSIGMLFVVFFIGSIQAQKFDKKYSENFKVKKDVEVVINASNAEIDVTTWNRNEVSVEATIEVEGLSKTAAQKFFKNWKFEALGNKSKVEIKASANRFLHFGDNDFTFDYFSMPDIDIPDIDFDIPDIDFPEMPDFPDFDNISSELDDYEFDEEGKSTFSYESNGKTKTVVINSKEDWEKFRKSSEYKKIKKELKIKLKEAKAKIGKIDKKKIEEKIKKAKLHYEKFDKEKIKAALAKAKASLEKMKLKMANSHKDENYVFVTESGKDKKKVKVTRKITIKVPENATFKLNTRHSKVKLPKGKVSGKVSYGAFNSNAMQGGNLNISFAPVIIDHITTSTLSLNNVTDATIASVINSKLISNSSKLHIETIIENVNVSSKFGELTIQKINSGFKDLSISLNYAQANVPFLGLNSNYTYEIDTSNVDFPNGVKANNDLKKAFLNTIGKYKISTSSVLKPSKATTNNIVLKASYSTLHIL